MPRLIVRLVVGARGGIRAGDLSSERGDCSRRRRHQRGTLGIEPPPAPEKGEFEYESIDAGPSRCQAYRKGYEALVTQVL